jgi:hypothetical protein
MRVLDPGHKYEVDGYDGGENQIITFMKREGPGYPFNVGHYGGTNIQEILRILIDRTKYLDKQVPCDDNKRLLDNLRRSLLELERRAALRHGWDLEQEYRNQLWDYGIEVEDIPTCSVCGHITCKGNHHDKNPKSSITKAT